jgi:hypothetical protein
MAEGQVFAPMTGIQNKIVFRPAFARADPHGADRGCAARVSVRRSVSPAPIDVYVQLAPKVTVATHVQPDG